LRRVVWQKEPQQADPVDPPINRAAQVRVDPIRPLLSPIAIALTAVAPRNLASTSLARASIHSPAPTIHALAPLLCAAHHRACASKPFAPLDPIRTLVAKWRRRRLLSRTRVWCVSVRNMVPPLTSSKRRGLSLNGRC
jgi:hypothetical protein